MSESAGGVVVSQLLTRLLAMKQGWLRVRSCLRWALRWVKKLIGFALICLLVAGATWLLVYVPKMQVPVCPPGKEGLPPKICFDIENEARKTLAYIMGGILAIIGITLAHRRIRALERQVLVAQEGQITERFTRAIEQLGSDKMEIRLGGIYALERIANDSDKDYWPIMETLTAYVRENAPWREPAPKAQEASYKDTRAPIAATSRWLVTSRKPGTDIQAFLTALGRRKYSYKQGEKERLDLHATDLRGADLENAHLQGADLSQAHLEGANLTGTHLESANLTGTHLEDTDMIETRLEGAWLMEAHLERAELLGAYLKNALLTGAHIEGAKLVAPPSERFPFEDTTGLTRQQLSEAIIDENTKLPDYLQNKRQEREGTEGDHEK